VAPSTLISSLLIQLLGGVSVAVQLLVLREVLAILTNRVGGSASFATALPFLALLVVAWATTGLAATLQSERQRLLGELMRHRAESLVVDAACAVDLKTFESPEFHDRLSRALAGAFSRPFQMVIGLLGILNISLSIAGIAAALLAIAPALLPLILLAGGALLFAGSRNSQAFYLFAWQSTPKERGRAYLVSLLTDRAAAKEVRAFGVAEFLRARYAQLSKERIAELRRMIAGRLRISILATLANASLIGIGVVLLSYLALSGRLGLAAAGAAATAVLVLGQRLQGLTYAATSLYESALFVEDFSSFLAEAAPSAISAQPDAGNARTAVPAGLGRLEVDRLSFTYPGAGAPALHDVCLSIGRSEVVALVGENGSGKTTLAKLLCGLYSPDAGRILWDGVDVAGFDRSAHRALITVVFQDFVRYLLSVRENIGVGRPESLEDHAAIHEAARQAGADRFISTLPEGYETILGGHLTGGNDLSVGQWQQLALARAFFRDAPFLVLDEPTAALDARAEHDLFERMRSLARGRSVLLISHRFSNVRTADCIYVLAHGRVVEHGTHEELLRLAGRYAELYRLQASTHLGS
jgi:ATP-binding cassette subfamily B protein